MNDVELTDFQPYLNQQIAIRFSPEVTLNAELIEAKQIQSVTVSPDRVPFSLIFRTGQKGEYYNQAIFGVQHPEKGEIPMFLVPLGPDASGMRYQAIFS